MATATAKGPFPGLSEQQKETFAGLASCCTVTGVVLLVVGLLSLLGDILGDLTPLSDLTEVALTLAAGAAGVFTGRAARVLAASPFEESQRPALAGQSARLYGAAVLVIGLGLLGVAVGLILLFFVGSVGLGLLTLLEGALTAFLGLVLLAVSADLGYLAATRGYEDAHTANATDSLQAFFRTLAALATLIVLVAVVRAWLYFNG
jgi:hypothetical protein